MNSKEFKVIFLGTSEFAQKILEHLFGLGVTVVAVVTKADKPTGRHLQVSPSLVKRYVLSAYPHLPVYDPVKVSTLEFEQVLSSYQPDLFVVAAFGEIIRPSTLAIPACGSINVQPSSLPLYRGPSPLQAALFNGDRETAVCIIDVAEKMDAGVVYAKKVFSIDPEDNFTSLEQKALFYSKDLLKEVIRDKERGLAVGVPQDESQVVFCKKILTNDEKIDWEHPLEKIHHQIRALSDKPGAWSYIQLGQETKRVKLYSSVLMEAGPEVNLKKMLYVMRGSIILNITSLQVEGKKRLQARDFISGLKTSYKFI